MVSGGDSCSSVAPNRCIIERRPIGMCLVGFWRVKSALVWPRNCGGQEVGSLHRLSRGHSCTQKFAPEDQRAKEA